MACQCPPDYDTVVPILITRPTGRSNSFRGSKVPVSYTRPMFLGTRMTCLDVYLYVINYFRAVIEEVLRERVPEGAESLPRLVDNPNPMLRLLIVNPNNSFYHRYTKPCPFCRNKNCKNCQLPLSNSITVAELLQCDRDFALELEWNRSLQGLQKLNNCTLH